VPKILSKRQSGVFTSCC